MMIGEALAWAGLCCKAFSESVPKAATVIAGHHGWNVPLAGCQRVRPLSKLEQDTMRLHYYLRAMSTWWLKPQIEFFNLWWTDELSLGFIGPLYIYHQVCRQHTMELGALLIKLGVDACRMPDDVLVPVVGARGTRCDENSLRLGTQLTTMLTDPSTPLDASWLAAHVMVPPANIQHFLNELPHPIFRMGLLLRDELMWLYTYGGATAFDTVRSSFCAVYH